MCFSSLEVLWTGSVTPHQVSLWHGLNQGLVISNEYFKYLYLEWQLLHSKIQDLVEETP